MKRLLILGAGTGGTALANRMLKKLPSDWGVTVVDPGQNHVYQPGLLFIPFGMKDDARNIRPRHGTLRKGVEWVQREVERIDRERKQVLLTDGHELSYDLLVIASGAGIEPSETPGLESPGIHQFYTYDGAKALQSALADFNGGRLLLNVVEMPIKCPVAPLEFMFLADDFFTGKGIRDKVELVYATPMVGAFTRPICSKLLAGMLTERSIHVESEFSTMEVDPDAKKLISYDGREMDYDLLVSIPVHKGAAFIEASGLGNELRFVPTHPKTLQSKADPNIFVLGDATDLPSSKAGSVAHFQVETLEINLMKAIGGEPLVEDFDGHANCFVETGFGKAMLIDFNYETEPLPGSFPLPIAGPMSLLKETRLNHFGKLSFRWVYWNLLLPGRPIPISRHMTMTGKYWPNTKTEECALCPPRQS
jgi:sulfide:quinone oxidoreductase